MSLERISEKRQDEVMQIMLHIDQYDPNELNELETIITDRFGYVPLSMRYALAAQIIDWTRTRKPSQPAMSVKVLRTARVQDRVSKTLAKMRSAAWELYTDAAVGRDLITLSMVAERSGLSIGTAETSRRT